MSTWKGIVGRGFRSDKFHAYVGSLQFTTWRPQFVVLHNTSRPQLSQWHSIPGETRMQNLQDYFKNTMRWRSGPHLFIADDLIWVFTPLTTSGTHSPSWNGISWGVEMVGDYDVEPLNPAVRENTVDALATLHAWRGISPDTLHFHKEDPKTTHKDCPGRHVDKADLVARVHERMAGGNLGEHVLSDDYLTLGAASPARFGAASTFETPFAPAIRRVEATTTGRYVTAFNYQDNSPAYSDYVARGRHKGGGGAPPLDFRAEIGRNDFANPSSLSVGPEADLDYGSRVFIEDYGWFLVEDHTAWGLSDAPRFDVWTAGAAREELDGLTGEREVTVFPPGSDITQGMRQRKPGSAWNWESWTSKSRVSALKKAAGAKWHGLYVEGQLIS